jgi:cell division protease FtsH
MVMTDEKKMTAYHEAGHAIVSVNEPARSDPQGDDHPARPCAGHGHAPAERDRTRTTATRCANLSVSMGGRVAEEIIFGYDKVSSGASSDIQYATSLARSMVTKWGMSDKLGPLQYEDSQEGYLGMGGTQRTMMSDETNKLIDSEIRGLVDGAHARAVDILKTNEEKLHLLANALLEYETLTGDEIKVLLETGKIDRPDAPGGSYRPVASQGSAVPRAGRRFSGGGAGRSRRGVKADTPSRSRGLGSDDQPSVRPEPVEGACRTCPAHGKSRQDRTVSRVLRQAQDERDLLNPVLPFPW